MSAVSRPLVLSVGYQMYCGVSLSKGVQILGAVERRFAARMNSEIGHRRPRCTKAAHPRIVPRALAYGHLIRMMVPIGLLTEWQVGSYVVHRIAVPRSVWVGRAVPQTPLEYSLFVDAGVA